MDLVVTPERDIITSKIYEIRGIKVMLDRDLAVLYQVETRTLNQLVKRNLNRFPIDFMFQLTKEEFQNWKSQIVISNSEKMGLRKRPLVFTEHGILMLSNILKSDRAIDVSVQIIHIFVELRQAALKGKEALIKISEIEQRLSSHDQQISVIFEAIQHMFEVDQKEKKFGFIN